MRGPEDGARPRAMQKLCKITPFMCPETYCADAGPIRHSKVHMGSTKLPNPRPRIVFAGSERGRSRVCCSLVCSGTVTFASSWEL